MVMNAYRERHAVGAKLSPPNWKHWLHMPTLEVWQAVALSLDVDPKSIKHPDWDSFDRRLTAGITDFADRLSLARECLFRGLNTVISLNTRKELCRVLPGEFVTWAQGVGWTLPAALIDGVKKAAREEPLPTQSEKEPPTPDAQKPKKKGPGRWPVEKSREKYQAIKDAAEKYIAGRQNGKAGLKRNVLVRILTAEGSPLLEAGIKKSAIRDFIYNKSAKARELGIFPPELEC